MPIEMRDVVFRYGDRVILDGFDSTLREGSLVGLVGPSGVGKSTLLGLISGELRAEHGSVCYPDLPGGPDHLLAASIGWIMQTTNVFGNRTVLDNVLLPAWIGGSSRTEAAASARDALAQVGLESFEERRCASLSGGERQRVAMARALAGDNPVVLADEPTASLDRANRDQLADLLVAAAASGVLVVVATHDPAVAARCDDVIEL
ncbi:MAG: ABC transporter ATP-binding protein [Acidimicrobiales bacterium]|nr:ABC transporter ATP-binding protein [Acidimicrobiales bacterium]